MNKKIYIRITDESVLVYRPVTAEQVTSKVFILKGRDVYDPDDECWEFLPGDLVVVEEKILDGEVVLVAIKKK